MNKKLSILLLFIVSSGTIFAVRYTILYLNTTSLKVGSQILKVGDSFSEEDVPSIDWKSAQVIKVRNEESKRTCVITERKNELDFSPSLTDYLTRDKPLVIRDYGSNKKALQLLDSITLNVTGAKKSSKFIAVWHDGVYKVRTELPLSKDGKHLYLTRSIYGHHTPQKAYILFLEYNTRTNAEPANLGYLLVEPLPYP